MTADTMNPDIGGDIASGAISAFGTLRDRLVSGDSPAHYKSD
jgi:hypothetical protein